jgi:protein-glucosylgalactosylhydroxylysine glucosidase
MDIIITPKKDITITGASVMEAPDALKDVQNYYNEIDRPHTTISLLTSSAKSPTAQSRRNLSLLNCWFIHHISTS